MELGMVYCWPNQLLERHHPSPGISHIETISRQSQGGGIVQEALIAPGPVWFATNDKMLWRDNDVTRYDVNCHGLLSLLVSWLLVPGPVPHQRGPLKYPERTGPPTSRQFLQPRARSLIFFLNFRSRIRHSLITHRKQNNSRVPWQKEGQFWSLCSAYIFKGGSQNG
jgi:hypothetical protein